MPPLRVEFFKGPTRRYRSVLRRPDGVDVELDGGAYNDVGGPAREVPHDIAHLIVEDELGLREGVWGVLADGGLFRGAKVVAGRRRPHAAERAREIVRARTEALTQAEMLTAAVCRVAERGGPAKDLDRLRYAVGDRWWSAGVTRTAIERATERLHESGERWAQLSAGASLGLTFEHPAVRS